MLMATVTFPIYLTANNHVLPKNAWTNVMCTRVVVTRWQGRVPLNSKELFFTLSNRISSNPLVFPLPPILLASITTNVPISPLNPIHPINSYFAGHRHIISTKRETRKNIAFGYFSPSLRVVANLYKPI